MSRRPKTLKVAKRRAWGAISRYVRRSESEGGMVKCVTCDTRKHWKDMHCGHFIHGLTYAKAETPLCQSLIKGETSFYPLIENVHAQCNACNTYMSGRLDVYTLWMIDMYGREMVEELQSLRHNPLKMRIDDYWEIEKEYTERFDELESDEPIIKS